MTDQPQGRQLQPPRSRVPEPRNPKAHGFQPPAEPPGEATAQALEAQTPEATLRSQSASKLPTAAPGASGGLRKAQIYVDKPIDDYLWQIRAEAAGQRLDVSSAAVARLAFHRLMEEMTPKDVLRHLATAHDSQGPGRKRR